MIELIGLNLTVKFELLFSLLFFFVGGVRGRQVAEVAVGGARVLLSGRGC